MNSSGNDPRLTAQIVSKYVAHHKLAPSELSDLISTVYQAMSHLGQTVAPEEAPVPAVSVRRSVQHDHVVCLDCGFRAVTLRRHVKVRHGLSPDEYLRRWGLKADHPLTAPAYSERRSTMAKALGFGRKAATEGAPPVTPAAAAIPVVAVPEAQPTPRRRARTGRATTPAVVTKEAAVPTPNSRRRSGSRARVASQPDQAASPTAES